MNLELMILALVCAFLIGVTAIGIIWYRWAECKAEEMDDISDQVEILREELWKVEERIGN